MISCPCHPSCARGTTRLRTTAPAGVAVAAVGATTQWVRSPKHALLLLDALSEHEKAKQRVDELNDV